MSPHQPHHPGGAPSSPDGPGSQVAFTATASPEPPGTKVAFLATLDINGQSVPISTGDVTNGISNLVFSLANPVDLGSISNFLGYLNTQIGVPLSPGQIEDWINEIPSDPAFLGEFKTALLKIFNTHLTITVLNVNVAAGTFMLGVTFPVQLELTSFLTLNSIGMVVSRGGEGDSPP